MEERAVFTQTKDGVLLRVYVQPKSRRQQIHGLHQNRLKLAVTEPPDRGRANEAVIDLLAEVLQVPRSQIELVRGGASRSKDILLRGQMTSSVEASLAAWL